MKNSDTVERNIHVIDSYVILFKKCECVFGLREKWKITVFNANK